MQIEHNQFCFAKQSSFSNLNQGTFQNLDQIAIDTLSQQNDSQFGSNQKDEQSQKSAFSQISTELQNHVQSMSLKNIKSKEEIEIESKENQQILFNLNSNIDDLFKKISSLTEQITTDLQPRPLKERLTSIVERPNNETTKKEFQDWQKIQSTSLFEFKSSLNLTEIKSDYKPIFFQLPQKKRSQFSIDMKIFQTGKSLGCGKFGQVVQCRNIKTNSLYALKKIFKSVVDDYGMQDQLLTELRILKHLNHPNIVKAYESFTDDFHIFILMQFIHGDMLVKKLKCTEKECKIIIRQVLNALKYLHQNDIAHRDIKPQNIIITGDNVIKICDFGWAAQGKEEMNILCGTLDYICPEMAREQPYTHKVDLWNLGVLTYQLIHGYPPFKGSKSRIFEKVKNLEYNFSDQIQISQQCKWFINGFLKNESERQSIEWGLNHEFLKTQDQTKELSIFYDQDFKKEVVEILGFDIL